MYAGDYTVQNVAKVLSCLVPHLFALPGIPYSDFLHRWLGSMQADGTFGGSLSSFGLNSAADIVALVGRLRVPGSVIPADPLLQCVHLKPSWATVLVHQCEVRQALQTVGYRCVARVLEAPKRQYRSVVSDTLSTLCLNPRRANCFATTLLHAAAGELHIRTGGSPWSSKAKLLQASVALAAAGFSPKVSVGGIPEWLSLVKVCFLLKWLTPDIPF